MAAPTGSVAALFPFREPVVDPNNGFLLTQRWQVYFRDQEQQIATIPSSANRTALTAQTASISTTPFPSGSLSAGLYRVTYYARITAAAVTSSSLTVTLSWTQATAALSHSFAAITGNTTLTTDSGTFMMLIDGGTPISYSTTYASNVAGTMAYTLEFVLEAVNA